MPESQPAPWDAGLDEFDFIPMWGEDRDLMETKLKQCVKHLKGLTESFAQELMRRLPDYYREYGEDRSIVQAAAEAKPKLTAEQKLEVRANRPVKKKKK